MFALSLAATVALSPSQPSAGGRRCGNGGGIYDVRVPGAPMGAVSTPDEQTVFVSINSANPQQPNGVAVLRCVSGRYQFDRLVPVENQPTISTLTPNAEMLVVPDDNYIAFLDVQRILSGSPQPIAGYMEDIPNDDGGAIYSAVSPDGRFAFISEEQSGKLTVVDLQKVATGSTTRDAIVSEFLIGNAPVALVFSKDGTHLFATVQIALRKVVIIRIRASPKATPAATWTLRERSLRSTLRRPSAIRAMPSSRALQLPVIPCAHRYRPTERRSG